MCVVVSLYNTHTVQAKKYVANQHQSNMIEGYIKSYVPLFDGSLQPLTILGSKPGLSKIIKMLQKSGSRM